MGFDDGLEVRSKLVRFFVSVVDNFAKITLFLRVLKSQSIYGEFKKKGIKKLNRCVCERGRGVVGRVVGACVGAEVALFTWAAVVAFVGPVKSALNELDVSVVVSVFRFSFLFFVCVCCCC